ncbi:MAG: hypothetical protein M1834_003080 [Cirrosporium novae-zelandiae]|nr:MAG: hypothetical protein M1834_003080 [Cirrosporium novae-zelandiae]
MAFYTKISDTETPTITIDPGQKLAKIDRKIYSGFTEHMGRCIYGGIYDPGNPLSDEDGFRKDVLEALKELEPPVMRYPGGNFVATYHWVDGVGPKNRRPARPELAWLGTESNEFGTDEFMKWCKKLGTEPYFALNFGTGTLDEALTWVEYCNGTGNTYYANLRRQNGHPEPYNIKYWALGNEMWGPWQVGQMTPEAYADRAIQWAKALKLLDPTLCLILCGKEGATTWDFKVLKHCLQPLNNPLSTSSVPLVDMHSIHLYTMAPDHVPNAVAPLAAERAIEITSSLIDLARIENKVPSSQPKTTICFDEWNVWSPTRAPGHLGAEETYTLSDALAVGIWLNVFIRQAQHVGMANIAQSVNVISPLMTTKDKIIKQTTWWPFLLFCKYMRGWSLGVGVKAAAWTEGDTVPEWMRGTQEGNKGGISYLDCSASIDDDGIVSLCIVNIHEAKGWDIDLKGVKDGAEVKVYEVTGSDVMTHNMGEKENVGLTERTWDGKGKFAVKSKSVTMLRWKA